MAKDKSTKSPSKTTVSTAVAAAGEAAGRIKITGNDLQRAAKIAEHLEAGGTLNQIHVDKFTRLPDNITIHNDGTVTGALKDHSADPIPPGTEGAFDPLAPEPFVPTAPLASVAEGETIVLTHTPYHENRFGPQYSQELVDRSNQLANKIWPTAEAYTHAQSRAFNFPSTKNEFTEIAEATSKNGKQFDHYSLRYEVQRALGFDYGRGNPNESSFGFIHRAGSMIAKLRRLEKKRGSDAVIDDETRERIIDTILMPAGNFGLADQFHSTTWLDMRVFVQKPVINELLSKEDMYAMETLLNYIPRLRNLLTEFSQHPGPYNKEQLMMPLKGELPADDQRRRYVAPSDDRKMLATIKLVHFFFDQVIPSRIIQDFLPELQYPRKSQDAQIRLQKVSRSLREASAEFVADTGMLYKVLEKIVELHEELNKFFEIMINELQAVYNYLNRTGMSFEKLVEDSKDKIEQSEVPW